MGRGVRIPIRLEKEQAEKDTKELKDELKSALKESQEYAILAKEAFDKFKEGLSEIISITREVITVSAEHEKQEVRTLNAIQLRSKFSEEDFARLREENEARQQSTSIHEAQQLKIQGTAALMGIEASELSRVTTATIALAEITGKDLDSALVSVVKAHEGNFKALQKLGIEVTSADGAMDALAGKISVVEAGMSTWSGQTQLLGANLETLFEALGDGIVKNEDAKAFLKLLNADLAALVQEVKTNGPTLSSWVSAFAWELTTLENAAKATADAVQTVTTVLSAPTKAQGLQADLMRKVGEETDRMMAEARANAPKPFDPKTAQEGGELEFGAGSNVKVSQADLDALHKKQEEEFKKHFRAMELEHERFEQAWIDRVKKSHEIEQHLHDEYRDAHRKFLDKNTADDLMAIKDQTDLANRHNKEAFEHQFAFFEGQIENQQQLQDVQKELTDHFYKDLSMIGGAGMGQFIASVTVAALSGKGTLEGAIGSLFGGMLQQVGSMMIALGSAQIVGGTAATIAPFLAAIFGVGPAAGLSLIAAGGVLEGVGGALSALGSSTSSSAIRSVASATRSSGGDLGTGTNSRLSQPAASTGPAHITNVININGARGLVVGEKQEMARWIADMLAAHQGLMIGGG